jgi:hypothetical protein
MKKGIGMLFVFTCICIFMAKAQSPRVYAVPKNQLNDSAFMNRLKDKTFVDSLRNVMKYRNPGKQIPLAGSMPRKFNYMGNNSKGFDIYQTPQDNMYILRPDSSFVSNMPVANSLQMQTKPVDMPNPKKERRD